MMLSDKNVETYAKFTLFFLVIKHAMAKAFELLVGNLFTKLFAHTHCVLGHFTSAWTMSAFFQDAFAYCLDNFFVGIINNSH